MKVNKNEEDGIHGASVVHAFSVASQRVMGDVLGQERLKLIPEGIGNEIIFANSRFPC